MGTGQGGLWWKLREAKRQARMVSGGAEGAGAVSCKILAEPVCEEVVEEEGEAEFEDEEMEFQPLR